MNKPDIVEMLSRKYGMTKKKVDDIITDTFEIILDTIARGERVHIAHFGSFTSSERTRQEKYNVTTGGMRTIEATVRPKYKPCKELIKKNERIIK